MGGRAGVLDVIGLVYEAALTPQHWPQVLESVADAVGGDGAALHFQDQITGKGWGMVARIDPDAVPLYFGHFATRNPIRHRRNNLLRLADDAESWRARVVTDEHALPKGELMRSEYYNDFMRQFDIHSLLMVGLAVEETRFATINFLRSHRRAQFGTREIEAATLLQPHLIRAFELSLKLSGMQQLNAGFAQSLDRSPHGIFLVDADARVRHVNGAGEMLATGQRGLVVRNGVLCGATADATRKLHRIIATAGSPDAERRSGGAMSLPRAGFRWPLSMIVAPLRSEQMAFFGENPSVIVCATDPEMGTAVPEDRLKDLFGLTPAEAKVALELLAGGDPATIAKRLALSVHTVRVHVARIMAKTDTSRQAELVRLLERVSGICFNAA